MVYAHVLHVHARVSVYHKAEFTLQKRGGGGMHPPPPPHPRFKLSAVRAVCGSSYPRSELSAVRAVCGSGCPQFELFWVRVILGSSYSGIEFYNHFVLFSSTPVIYLKIYFCG